MPETSTPPEISLAEQNQQRADAIKQIREQYYNHLDADDATKARLAVEHYRLKESLKQVQQRENQEQQEQKAKIQEELKNILGEEKYNQVFDNQQED